MPKPAPPVALAITILRVSLGIMFLAHSLLLKFFTVGLPGTAAFFRSVGLPEWLAYLTLAVEVIGGLMLVLGIHVRWAVLALAPFMLGALFTVHLENGWVFSTPGGGWEYPAYLFVLCIAQSLLGEGAYALVPSRPLNRGVAGPSAQGTA